MAAYLDIPSTNHNAVHLFHGQRGSLWYVVLDEGEPLVFVGDAVPRQVDTFDWPKRLEGLFYCVFFNLKVYTPNVYSTSLYNTILLNNIFYIII